MEVRVVAAGRGWQWVAEGYALFRRNPTMWIALILLLGFIWLASLVIPVLGPLLFNLLSPVFAAGLMVGCRALENGEPLEIGHLFAGFRQQAGSLVTIGGVYLVGTIVVLGLVFLAAGGSMLPTMLAKGSDIETLRAALRSLAFALAVGALAYLPLIMMIWFAPMLIVFRDLQPVPAMKLSFFACLRNALPFLVYGLAILGAWLVLSLPLALGPLGGIIVVGLIVISIPVLVCSVYASYKDVFMHEPAVPAGRNPFLR